MSLKPRLTHLPTPLSGLALGIASLGLCLESRLNSGGMIQLVSAIIAAGLLLLLALKYWFNKPLLSQDLAHPVVGSVMPTFAMATMLISKTLGQTTPLLGSALWMAAVTLHLSLLMGWLKYRAKSFKFDQMVPSWYIPPIGIIVAAVTSPGGHLETLAHWLLQFGLYAFALMLPLMLYRLIFRPEVADAAKPTIAVMAAPASLSLTGYLNITSEPSLPLVGLLLGLALLMTSMIYLAFTQLLRLPFSPGFSAFTFPMVIGAAALYQTATLVELMGLEGGALLHQIADVELAVATIIVGYVSLRYLLALLPSLTKKPEPSLQL